MGIERVDYYSDDEYGQALQYEEEYRRDAFDRHNEERRIEELWSVAEPYVIQLKDLDPYIVGMIFNEFCNKCCHQKSQCICNQVVENDMPW